MLTVTFSPELTLLYLLSGLIGVTLHELGHLLVPLRMSRAPVTLQVGGAARCCASRLAA